MGARAETDCMVVVFARAPVAGAVKTRLIPRLGAQGACDLYRRMVDRTLATAIDAGVGPVEFWCTPDTTHPYFRQCVQNFGVRLARQHDGDIGVRMDLALRETLQRAAAVILIGTDCPALTVTDLRASLELLRGGHDAVFLPVEDGGYTLVALRAPQPTLFHDIDWSTERVMTQTRERLRTARLRWQELAMRGDVDRPEDLDRWLDEA